MLTYAYQADGNHTLTISPPEPDTGPDTGPLDPTEPAPDSPEPIDPIEPKPGPEEPAPEPETEPQ